MRAIVRFSLENDRHPTDSKKSGYLNSKLSYFLETKKLMRHRGRTGTYEGFGDDITIDLLRETLDEFFKKIKGQKTATLDHFWMFVDNGPSLKEEGAQSQQNATRKKASQVKKES